MDGIGSGIGKLGFGLMRLPVLEDGKIDIEQTKDQEDGGPVHGSGIHVL